MEELKREFGPEVKEATSNPERGDRDDGTFRQVV
jgi:hypothetical protein